MVSLVWMRRDLRLHDHAALATALAEASPVQPVFVFDSEILARFANPNDRRLSFIAARLCAIDAELKKRGGKLLVLHGKAAEVMPKLATVLDASAIFSAEDFEPATMARDAKVKAALSPCTRFVQVLDHLLLNPRALLKGDGSPYKVFTPFYKLWRASVGQMEMAAYEVKDKGRYADAAGLFERVASAGLKIVSLDAGHAELLKQIGYQYTADELWRVDDVTARVKSFITSRMSHYPTARDQLPVLGTSRLSPYLRFGLVSIREVMRAAVEAGGGEKWISELGWREFYASILFHCPHVVEHEFAEQYRGTIDWVTEGPTVDAFVEGRTGYPVVDAAVRELLTTGFMHNRARMIVASFATKDLLIDWRVGEAFFAQHLMDYDLASNNGGWQWAASTGTDAAPYFRVFNPMLQSKKFDPEGEYIRRYVPELRDVPNNDIHAPWESMFRPTNYPLPVVDHSFARDRVLVAFKRAKAN